MTFSPSRVVFDIETLAYPMESFDQEQQEYLLKFATTEQERIEAIERLSLGPLTARVMAIAMLNPDTGKGQVFYDHPEGKPWFDESGMVEYVPGEEREILERFWSTISKFRQFITFNGRSFDCPFLMIRSAVLGVKASRNLVPYRYKADESFDLMEQITFYGASRKYSLDFCCKAFGIHSPKTDGITGKQLGSVYAEGGYEKIARYCMGDVRATAELFRRWKDSIGFDL
ncbi:MAG: ribonuclease H-like domain-containing protein [Bacteroidota bacterium]